jgi:monovalent cation:H+ antiporter-2, CPA2 family
VPQVRAALRRYPGSRLPLLHVPRFIICSVFRRTHGTHEVSQLFVEIGAAVILLAVLARFANRWGFSAIPLYLLAGLAFGNGGLAPLPLSQDFIGTGAEIGVLMLLFMLRLECSGDELKRNLRLGLPAGMMDILLNFSPGLAAGLLLG